MEINEYWGALCLLFKNQGVLAEQGSLLVLEQMINERPSILPMQQWENDFGRNKMEKNFTSQSTFTKVETQKLFSYKTHKCRIK